MERPSYFVILWAILPALVSSQISYEKLKPSSYSLKITVPDTAASKTFQGHVELEVSLSTASSHLALDAEQLTITDPLQDISIYRNGTRGGLIYQEISGVNFTYNTLIISCTRALVRNTYTISINFTGAFQNDMTGFAKVPFFYNDTERFLGVTSFEPNFAQRAFPCSNDPSNRAKFTLEFTVDHSQIVLSNVKPTTVYNISDTKRVFKFNSYPSMPVHQLGWAVFDHTTYVLHARNTTDSKVIHTRSPKLYSNHTTWACQFTAELTAELGAYLNEPYPLDKLEQVVIPEFFSGTSKGYGIISYSEQAILVSPEQTSSRDKQRIALTLSEGIIGQWFGDYITMDSWENMWLVKGLSEYLKYNFTSSLDKMAGWELNDHMVVELIQQALSLDNENNSLTIADQEDEQTKIETAYGDATSTKAAAIIRMLHNILGKDVFDSSLRAYVSAQSLPQNQGGNIGTPEDFWNNAYMAVSEADPPLDLAGGLSVSDIMDGWVAMKGHPTVHVSTNGSHFLIVQADSSISDQLYIPITYIVQNSPSDVKKTWLKSDSILTIPKSTPNQWILVNVDQTGFYRVNYHEALWAQLQEQLLSNHLVIPRISRSQLIDDLFSFTINGVLSMDFLMNFTKYLSKEIDYFPWYTALRNFQNIVDSLYGFDSYRLFQNHLLFLMEGVTSTVGMNAEPTDSHTAKMRQSLILEKACALGHVQCQRKAASILGSWMSASYYDADLSMALMCAGVASSSVDTWWKLHKSYYESLYPTVRANILTALTCSTNTALMNEFLTNITLSSNPLLNNKERGIFMETLASKPAGAELILNWMIICLSPETNQTVQPEPVTDSATTSTEPANSSSNAINNLPDVVPTSETDLTNSNTSQEAETSRITKREVPESTSSLTDDQIKSILNLVIPKLTTVGQGVKLERLLNATSLPISNDTRTYIQGAAKQIYEKQNATAQYNEKLTVWLSNNVDLMTTSATSKPTASDSNGTTLSSSTPPKPSGAPNMDVHSSHIILVTSAILLSYSYYL